MNRKQLLLLIVVGAVIVGAGLWAYKKRQGAWEEKGQTSEKLFADFPLNDVARIIIKQTKSELNLEKKNDLWRVVERGDFPANFTEISEFLRKMWEMKAGQPVEVGPSNLGRLELLPPEKGANSGTLVEFKNKDGKLLASLLLGKKSMRKAREDSPFGGGGGEWPDGRFLMVGNDLKTIAQVRETFNNIEPKPESWLNKDFFKVEKVKSMSLVATNATNSWSLSRDSETNEWKLADLKKDEQLDSSKVSGVTGAFANPSFNDAVLASAKPEETGFDQPTTVHLETFDGFTYKLKVGKKTAEDNYYLGLAVEGHFAKERTPGQEEKPEDKVKLDKEFQDNLKKLKEKLEKEKQLEGWHYLVSKWSVDSGLKDRKDLLVEKKEEPKKEETKTETPQPEAPTIQPPKKDEAKPTPVKPAPPKPVAPKKDGAVKKEPKPGDEPPKPDGAE